MDTRFIVRGSDGSIDVTASSAKFATALTEFAKGEVPADTIELAVETVFDRYPAGLTMPALIHYSVTQLEASSEQYRALSDRVHSYVTGQFASGKGRLDIAKGKGGGVKRLACPGEPIPARAEKPAKL